MPVRTVPGEGRPDNNPKATRKQAMLDEERYGTEPLKSKSHGGQHPPGGGGGRIAGEDGLEGEAVNLGRKGRGYAGFLESRVSEKQVPFKAVFFIQW